IGGNIPNAGAKIITTRDKTLSIRTPRQRVDYITMLAKRINERICRSIKNMDFSVLVSYGNPIAVWTPRNRSNRIIGLSKLGLTLYGLDFAYRRYIERSCAIIFDERDWGISRIQVIFREVGT